jgi:hypothetical protein
MYFPTKIDADSTRRQIPQTPRTYVCGHTTESLLALTRMQWPYRRKVLITMLFGATTMCSTFTSSVYSPATNYVAKQYGMCPS